ncbi:glucose-1-phosphate thymidylyltransferase RfbA [Methylocapsa palsarum]|uniref:Glucose-1-phosphate thymidylyltransferase n=1 Tax=Methylocapsa palsarum TaxID=1612308 RepID=A0A1I4B021_9HYPH|nr:glucose-1-phosphate thymidylyltransferase RfbA [Methylocapsa palsarum]SFK62178.1 glucose-1-phosphate thymidylyltransferase [Methylocapsa palsarum]
MRKGIILAGGSGTRLHPLTLVTSKQLLPVYDKPMIYYPLSALMLAGIREIMIITTPQDQSAFKHLLGDGSQWGLRLEFAIQPSPDGLAQAFIIAADFISGQPSCLILGDNILYGHGLSTTLKRASADTEGATVFGYRVDQPERYGVIEFDADGHVLSIEEKPQNPKSRWAAVGVYFYDKDIVDLARSLKPSARGELEITDVNNLYIRSKKLKLERMERGFAWFDAGTHDSLMEAAEFVRVLQQRQGQLIAAPEEIAFLNGWIGRDAFESLAIKLGKTNYGRRLLDNVRAN